ncbi:ribosomal protein S5 domain 2-type protein [Cladochytrium replicatum]|nr:ribosomal protein S5 domain 2-type protein [Cladochytrium replicatum]
MSFHALSPSEIDYIRQGVAADLRADGRARLDRRRVRIETGLVSQASGSCLCVVDGGTCVLVGVKAEVGSVDPSLSEEDKGVKAGGEGGEGGIVGGGEGGEDVMRDRNVGRIVCHVDCSPSALRALSAREQTSLSHSYSQLLTRLLNNAQSSGIDLRSLCIIPGSTCWVLNVDVLVLDYGGNLLDAIGIAVRGALMNTRLAKTKVEELDGEVEFDIAEEETERVAGAKDVPVIVTVTKIGTRFVADASPLEELSASSRVFVAVNREGQISGVQKSGEGGIKPGQVAEMISTAREIGVEMVRLMDGIVSLQERREGEQKVGFSW